MSCLPIKLYNFKTKRYNVNLMNKTQSEPKHFGAFICDKMKKMNMMRKVPHHRNKCRDPNCRSGMTTVIKGTIQNFAVQHEYNVSQVCFKISEMLRFSYAIIIWIGSKY